MLDTDSKIYVAGHNGMVGSAIVRQLQLHGYQNLVVRMRSELDLCDQFAVNSFLEQEQPDYVVLAAARVGGIHANDQYPAEFIYQNLMIECNVINGAWKTGCKQVLFLGSSCIYPKFARQPMHEKELLTGPLEPTNEPYAIAKIAGIKLCESYNRQYNDVDYRSVMPTNLYGPNDNFHSENSHVIPALVRRFHEAKLSNAPSIQCWGTGSAMREFLHVDDMAMACIHVMRLDKNVYRQHTEPMLSHINIGKGTDITIKELAETIAKVTEYDGRIEWDDSKPDGTPKKLMDTNKIRILGWKPKIELEEGLTDTYRWFVKNQRNFRQF